MPPKQAKLFSFFSKASSTPKPKAKIIDSNSTAKATPSSDAKFKSSSASSSSSLLKEKTSLASSGNLYGEEVVGRRVEIYWPNDDEYYPGSIVSYEKDIGRHLIRYDDGEEEQLKLSNQKLQWLHKLDKEKDEDEKGQSVVGKVGVGKEAVVVHSLDSSGSSQETDKDKSKKEEEKFNKKMVVNEIAENNDSEEEGEDARGSNRNPRGGSTSRKRLRRRVIVDDDSDDDDDDNNNDIGFEKGSLANKKFSKSDSPQLRASNRSATKRAKLLADLSDSEGGGEEGSDGDSDYVDEEMEVESDDDSLIDSDDNDDCEQNKRQRGKKEGRKRLKKKNSKSASSSFEKTKTSTSTSTKPPITPKFNPRVFQNSAFVQDLEEEEDDYENSKQTSSQGNNNNSISGISSSSKYRTPSLKYSSTTSTSATNTTPWCKKAANLTLNTPGSSSGSTSTSLSKTPGSLSRSTTTSRLSLGGKPTPKSSITSSGSGSAEITANSEEKKDGVLSYGEHKHHSLSWLSADRRDHRGRKPHHPHFNVRTCLIPRAFLDKETEAMKQWWEFKSQMMDTILFFKVGKFYEIFHMDCDIATKELGLIYMKGDKAHCGFPEIGYGKFSAELVRKGYRIARCEQTETPAMLKERNDNRASGKKKDGVVRRELCSVVSKGTRTFNHLDQNIDFEETTSNTAPLLLAIREKARSDSREEEFGNNDTRNTCEFGVCFVDASTSKFRLGQFDDDSQRSRLRTLLIQYPPAEILYDFENTSKETKQLIQFLAPDAVVEGLTPNKEFWGRKKTIRKLLERKYFENHAAPASASTFTSNRLGGKSLSKLKTNCYGMVPDSDDEFEGEREEEEDVNDRNEDANEERIEEWPPIVKLVVEGGNDSSLCLQALGAVTWQLQRSLIDRDILSMKRFRPYIPPDYSYNLDYQDNNDSFHNGEKREDEKNVTTKYNGSENKMKEEGNIPMSKKEKEKAADKVINFTSMLVQNDEEDLEISEISLASEESTTISANTNNGKGKGKDERRETDKENEKESDSDPYQHHHMVIDGITLNNLEILRNDYDGSPRGSLWAYINKCSTSFGSRLLREWLVRPLMSPKKINARFDAIEDLVINFPAEAGEIRTCLKNFPDVERALSKFHSFGSIYRANEHPDSRAVMYEGTLYSKRKLNEFLTVIGAFKGVAATLPNILSTTSWNSFILEKIAKSFPDLSPQLEFFLTAFDANQVKRDGVIKPKQGVDPNYDQAKDDIREIHGKFDAYLDEQKNVLKCPSMIYFGSKKDDRFQLEVPERYIKKTQPREYEAKSKKKGFRRFHTPTIRRYLNELSEAEERLEEAQRDQMRRMFDRFDSDRNLWNIATKSIAVLDAFLALSKVCGEPGFVRPTVLDPKVVRIATVNDDNSNASPCSSASLHHNSYINITQGKHPTLMAQAKGWEFIPNDTELGNYSDMTSPRMLLLSGPNMGGKSTLLRQTCVLIILAQMGCFVPCEAMEFTPMDRIFTRLGACDRILQGQSTFFVELSETATILNHATDRSLVILDELGRGTSTFDGTAIAHAVVDYLVQRKKCLTMFATHYHLLIQDWRNDPRVTFGHMACLVEADGDEQKVTFLYTLAEGPSPKSYGLNVARLAQLPRSAIETARQKSEDFEAALETKKNEYLARNNELIESQGQNKIVNDNDIELVSQLKELYLRYRKGDKDSISLDAALLWEKASGKECREDLSN